MLKNRFLAMALGCLIVFASHNAQAQTTAFSYQGSLTNNGLPANGSFDLEFKLFDSLTGGLQQGSTITKNAVSVTNGVFGVILDFGSTALPGANRFLELSAQTAGGGGFTTLAPRSQILSAPYAVSALNAQTAGTAQTVTGPISGSNATATLSVTNSAGGISPNSGTPPAGLIGRATSASGQTIGVFGNTNSTNGIGVLGITEGAGGGGAPSVGVFGVANSTTGPANGVMGETASSNGWGVYGNAIATSGPSNGVVGDSHSPNGVALVGRSFGLGDILSLTSTVAGGNPKLRVAAGGDIISLGNINATGGFRTAIGSFSAGGSPGTPNFNVDSNSGNIVTVGTIAVGVLAQGGSTNLCRNLANNQIAECSSSARYKSNINSFASGLDLIRKLRPVSFNWKDGGMADMGLVAEEVNAVEPLLTTTNAIGEIEGVKYDRVGVVLINAVKEQQAQIESQQVQIEAQRKQIEMLMKILCSQNAGSEACKSVDLPNK